MGLSAPQSFGIPDVSEALAGDKARRDASNIQVMRNVVRRVTAKRP
jgi:hypothetical protein